MNKLLRLANDLVVSIENMWADERMSVIGRKNVVHVIQGYQELIRRLIDNLEASDSYVENNRCLSDANDVLLLEARDSIPDRQ